MIGSTVFCTAPSFQPPAGSHLRNTANTSTSSGAITKFGMEMPVMAVAITA